jgi:hypothetical protein
MVIEEVAVCTYRGTTGGEMGSAKAGFEIPAVAGTWGFSGTLNSFQRATRESRR